VRDADFCEMRFRQVYLAVTMMAAATAKAAETSDFSATGCEGEDVRGYTDQAKVCFVGEPAAVKRDFRPLRIMKHQCVCPPMLVTYAWPARDCCAQMDQP
jgi:hypothetical protein